MGRAWSTNCRRDFMKSYFDFSSPPSDLHLPLRHEVRRFLASELESGTWEMTGDSWGGHCPELSRRLGEKGWLGLTWPKRYGGRERNYLERYVITEELLAAGAPTAAHWVADRQSGPLILKYGSEGQKERFLPAIAQGGTYFSIGMSEPDSGSDFASIQARARKVDGGWELSGTKIWTSGAHLNHFIIVLCRTSDPESGQVESGKPERRRGPNRHSGLSQLIVDLSSPGVTVRPIINLAGAHEFNEVLFESTFVPDEMLLGQEGQGWDQVVSELVYERGGPERFLTNFHLLTELIRVLENLPAGSAAFETGNVLAQLWTLRQMAFSVACILKDGGVPRVESALIKDLGTQLQQEIPDVVRQAIDSGRFSGKDEYRRLEQFLARAVLYAPAYTIQGGTTEILRGIVARGLGVR